MNRSTRPVEARVGWSTPGTLLYILVGPVVWGLQFGFLYFVQAVGCARFPGTDGNDMAPLLALIAVSAAFSLAFLVAALAWPKWLERLCGVTEWPDGQRENYRLIMRLLNWLSLFAILTANLAILFVPLCETTR
jgi:hypothetical protein